MIKINFEIHIYFLMSLILKHTFNSNHAINLSNQLIRLTSPRKSLKQINTAKKFKKLKIRDIKSNLLC